MKRTRKVMAALVGAALLASSAVRAQYYAPPPAYHAQGHGRGYAPPPPSRDEDRAAYDRYRGRPRDRARCRDNGTGGTIIGAIAGGLLGNAAAGRGDRGTGTIVGAGVGALAGRAIDRDC